MSDYVLNKIDELCRRVDKLEEHDQMPGYHEHLLDPDEHAAHHAAMGDKRRGERRKGGERRVSTEAYAGEERRAP